MFLQEISENTKMFLLKTSENTKMFQFRLHLSVQAHYVIEIFVLFALQTPVLV